YGLVGGSIFHGELSLEQLFNLRPAPGYADYRTPVDGLYYASSATHAGGGVCGIPGMQAAKAALGDARAARRSPRRLLAKLGRWGTAVAAAGRPPAAGADARGPDRRRGRRERAAGLPGLADGDGGAAQHRRRTVVVRQPGPRHRARQAVRALARRRGGAGRPG